MTDPVVTLYPGEPDPKVDTKIVIPAPVIGVPCTGQGVPLRLLTWEDEVDLIGRAQNGDIKARNTVVQGNLGLIHLQASRIKHPPEFFDDMIQEGILGLMRAIEFFDLKLGVRFSTYAMFWIRSKFNRCLDLNLKSIRWAPKNSGNLTESLDARNEGGNFNPDDGSLTAHWDKDSKVLVDLTVDLERDLVNKELAVVVREAAETTKEKHFHGDRRIPIILDKRVLAHEPLQIEAVGKLIGMSKEGARSLELRFLARMREVLEEALE